MQDDTTTDSSPTPPPLYYSPGVSEKGRNSTPVDLQTPPTDFLIPPPRKGKDKDKNDLYFKWHKKPGGANRNSNPLLGADWHFSSDPEEPLFEDDGGAFPLFPDSPPRVHSPNMSSAFPIDISLPPRFNSQSPRNHTSNLTFALQEAGASGNPNLDYGDSKPNPADAGLLNTSARNDSVSNMFGGSSYYGGASGPRPISVKDRPRRESNTAGSYMGGMSWGGISVGSWVRDDIMMAGTSPANFQNFPRSPSLHSSSYLPKMETNFLKDYQCCNKNIDSLHELLQHFEENHAQQSNQAVRNSSLSSQPGLGNRRPSNGASNTGESSRGFTGFDQQRQPQLPRAAGPQAWRQQQTDSYPRTSLATVQDMDALEDMDMDMGMGMDLPAAPPTGATQNRPYSQTNDLASPIAPTMAAQQAFGRQSTPTTPSANQAFSLFNNPTVSSVNTPALNTQPQQQSQTRTPDASIPGTPGELDPNFMNNNNFLGGGMGYQNPNDMGLDAFDFNSGIGFGGLTSTINDLTIDEPAKRLFSKQGGGMTNQQMQYAIKNGQIPMNDELAKRLREQQLVGGLGGPIPGFSDLETKPFKCPVIGCEKAYKNQNGLKYHKQHGHQNQKLKENNDGSFSIVDPVTSIPYPGTVGMEKEKPYRCEHCGKRYKNLNGLKYHRQHSPQCNPELKPTGNNAGLGNLQGLGPSANIAGVGLAGMGDGSRF